MGGESLGLVGSYQAIGVSLGLKEAYFSGLIATTLGKKDISFGNVIYSRVPFTHTNTTYTRGQYISDYNFDNDDYNTRAFQHVTIQHNTKMLHILNHHGHHIDTHKLGDTETMRQAMIIRDYIQKLDGGVILCGDFNLSPESESVQVLGAALRNLSVENNLQTTRSKLTYKNEVCDYIFVNDNIIVNNFSMDETIISDHNALILDFDIVP